MDLKQQLWMSVGKVEVSVVGSNWKGRWRYKVWRARVAGMAPATLVWSCKVNKQELNK
jgi:hypothetical protein